MAFQDVLLFFGGFKVSSFLLVGNLHVICPDHGRITPNLVLFLVAGQKNSKMVSLERKDLVAGCMQTKKW